MIAVSGATGNIGKEVVRQLVAKGQPVRVLARNVQKGRAMFPEPGVDIVQADLDQPESLEKALEGVDHAFLLSSTDPQQVALQGNFINAARKAGVEHVVKLSVVGADLNAPAQLMRWHAETEKHLEESGLGY